MLTNHLQEFLVTLRLRVCQNYEVGHLVGKLRLVTLGFGYGFQFLLRVLNLFDSWHLYTSTFNPSRRSWDPSSPDTTSRGQSTLSAYVQSRQLRQIGYCQSIGSTITDLPKLTRLNI